MRADTMIVSSNVVVMARRFVLCRSIFRREVLILKYIGDETDVVIGDKTCDFLAASSDGATVDSSFVCACACACRAC